jgi:hypothetical protein
VSVRGTFTGRFYGAAGEEIGGSFSVINLFPSENLDDGMAGAVALKR